MSSFFQRSYGGYNVNTRNLVSVLSLLPLVTKASIATAPLRSAFNNYMLLLIMVLTCLVGVVLLAVCTVVLAKKTRFCYYTCMVFIRIHTHTNTYTYNHTLVPTYTYTYTRIYTYTFS